MSSAASINSMAREIIRHYRQPDINPMFREISGSDGNDLDADIEQDRAQDCHRDALDAMGIGA